MARYGTFLTHATFYTERLGWKVLPVATIDGRKTPLVKGGCHAASTDRAVIEQWAQRFPRANLAVATGAASALFVIDVDGDAGAASLQALEHALGPIPYCPVAETRRGVHYYFRAPGPIRNSASRIAPGIDVRGDGGSAWLPPSVHETGFIYRWRHDPLIAPLAEPSRDLLRVLAGELIMDSNRGSLRPAPPKASYSAAGCATAVPSVDRALDRLRRAPRGQRNDTLYRSAFVCRLAIEQGLASESYIVGQLTQIALSIGLEPQETTATIASAFIGHRRQNSR